MPPTPKKPSDPDTENFEMQAAIGGAMDAWAIVVAHLCAIFAVAVSAKKYESAAAAFSSIRSFEDQLKMVDAAMAQSFADNDVIRNAWKAIFTQLKKVQTFRNKIAHGKLIPVVVEGGGIEFRFLPYFHFYSHKDRDMFEHMTRSDLVKVGSEIRDTIKVLAKFSKQLGARQEINSPIRIFKAGSSMIVKRA